MRSGVIIAGTREPADVHGVHGAEGLTRWTCLATPRSGLRGSWEAVEWACLPPGGVSGEHLHTRTEEVYLLLTGRGEITLDGRPHEVAAGDAVLTGLGTRHGLRNTGTEPLEWLVIEVTATDSELHEPIVHSTVVTDLRRVGPLDPRTVLTGPLRSIEVARLRAAGRAALAADGVEHTVFVTRGTGRAAPHGSGADDGRLRVPLVPGTAITLPLGTGVTLTAGRDGLEYVHAVLTVPEGRDEGAEP